MSKTFTGTVSFDFRLVLSDETIEDVMSYIQDAADTGEVLNVFQQHILNCPDVDSRLITLWRKEFRQGIKEHLQEIHTDTRDAAFGDAFAFSPIKVKMEGKV